jgi:hypothetical protein
LRANCAARTVHVPLSGKDSCNVTHLSTDPPTPRYALCSFIGEESGERLKPLQLAPPLSPASRQRRIVKPHASASASTAQVMQHRCRSNVGPNSVTDGASDRPYQSWTFPIQVGPLGATCAVARWFESYFRLHPATTFRLHESSPCAQQDHQLELDQNRTKNQKAVQVFASRTQRPQVFALQQALVGGGATCFP